MRLEERAERVRIAFIDDHRLMMAGLAALMRATSDLELVGEAASADQALGLLRRARPHLVIIKVPPGSRQTVAAIKDLRDSMPAVRILCLCRAECSWTAAATLAAGAHGFALKSQDAQEVLDAIRQVARGGTYLGPGLPTWLLDDGPRRAELASSPLAALSLRERQVFELVIRGLRTSEIGAHLMISTKTIETHRARINKKLGVHSSTEAVLFAIRHGLARDATDDATSSDPTAMIST